MSLTSQFVAIFQFVKTGQASFLHQLDTKWRGLISSVLIAFLVALPGAFFTDWMDTDPDWRILDFSQGWLVIIAGEALSVLLGLVIWFYLSWIFRWIALFRPIVVYLNWLAILLTIPLYLLSLLFYFGAVALVGEAYAGNMWLLLITGLLALLPALYYSVLALWRGCGLFLKTSLGAIVIFTCLDLLIRYKVLDWSFTYLQSGASLS